MVTRALPGDVLKPLEVFELEIWSEDRPADRSFLLAEIEDAEGLLCMLTDQIDQDLVRAAPRLRAVSQMAVGADNIDVEACARRGIPVGHTPGVLTDTVADTAFALMASATRRLAEGERMVRAGEWGPWDPFGFLGGDLHESVLGIVGMGRIGRAIAKRASGFRMDILYTSRNKLDASPGRRVGLSELLALSDTVVVSTALTGETRGMIGPPELRKMKRSALLVNVARGPLVQTDALVEALVSGVIGGAALDVTDPEPLPGDHPLLDLDNCLVVPHLGSSSLRTRTAMARLAVSNLREALEGRSMPFEVQRA